MKRVRYEALAGKIRQGFSQMTAWVQIVQPLWPVSARLAWVCVLDKRDRGKTAECEYTRRRYNNHEDKREKAKKRFILVFN